MTQSECSTLAHARVWREARRWIGASTNAAEHPGCVLWDDGGVEFNGHADQAMGCNVKGVCLCVADGGASERYATTADGGLGARGRRLPWDTRRLAQSRRQAGPAAVSVEPTKPRGDPGLPPKGSTRVQLYGT